MPVSYIPSDHTKYRVCPALLAEGPLVLPCQPPELQVVIQVRFLDLAQVQTPGRLLSNVTVGRVSDKIFVCRLIAGRPSFFPR